MYTGYAGFLSGNDKYAEAIAYLELAKSIDGGRAHIYDSEIEYLNSRI